MGRIEEKIKIKEDNAKEQILSIMNKPTKRIITNRRISRETAMPLKFSIRIINLLIEEKLIKRVKINKKSTKLILE